MERTKKSEESTDRRFIKTGGGVFHLRRNGKVHIIKQGQRFTAKLEEIPEAFRDTIEPVDGKAFTQLEEEAEASIDVAQLDYVIESRGGGYYDVKDANGKVMNEKALRKEAAENLLRSLTGK